MSLIKTSLFSQKEPAHIGSFLYDEWNAATLGQQFLVWYFSTLYYYKVLHIKVDSSIKSEVLCQLRGEEES